MARKKAQEIEKKEIQPTKIYSLIGHSKQIEFLKQSILNNRLSHAYLITGSEHIGKERVALEFIAAILSKSVEKLNVGIDYTVIERGADEKKKRHGFAISVDQIKLLRNLLTRQSLVASHTVVLIKEAETMNRSASNALLKTLEEPIPNTCLILLANHEEQLLATIRSRCQIIRLSRVEPQVIKESLITQGVSVESASEAAQISRGLPGVAVEFAHEPATREWQEKEIKRFFTIFDGNLHEKFQAIAPFVGSNRSADHVSARETVGDILTMWEVLTRDLLFLSYGLKKHVVYLANEDRFKKIVDQIGAVRLGIFLESIEAAREDLGQNLNGRLLIENLLLNINAYENAK